VRGRAYHAAVAVDPNSRLGRSVQAIAGSKAFAKVGPTVVPKVDRLLNRLFGGRVLMSSMMLPCAVVTTTGRRSGLPRESPLATVPLDGDLYVVGSNFGRPNHPAWSWNLLDDPGAQVSFRGEQYRATAHLLSEQEKTETWPRLIAAWPLFDQYVDRSGRDLRVFRLVRDPATP
jgi:deazaflavin-dependent oxidoreductase (nitroreductase family)